MVLCGFSILSISWDYVYWGPTFIKGNCEPDGQCVHRMQMVLSGPLLRYEFSPSLSPPFCSSQSFALHVLLHNCPISPLLKQYLESERVPCMGAGLFAQNPLLSLNAPFVPFIITIQRECHTLPNGKTVAAVWATSSTFTHLLIAFRFLGEIIIAGCHAILTKRLNFHFIFFFYCM